MNKKLTPEEISALNLYDYIIQNNTSDIILDKMHAINHLDKTRIIDENIVKETYTREIYLRGKIIYFLKRECQYNKKLSSPINYNIEEKIDNFELKELLMKCDYKFILLISREVGLIELIKNENQILK